MIRGDDARFPKEAWRDARDLRSAVVIDGWRFVGASIRELVIAHPEETVIPSSVPVIIATAALTLLGAVVLAWAYWRGLFRDLDAQSRVIFEPKDLRLDRPWESPVERLERETMHGELIAPAQGEWGGAS